MINNEAYREWAIEHEYEISRQVNYLATKCPHVSWEEAQKLYQLAVEKAKIFLKVPHICDATFGRGLFMVKKIFTEDITSLEHWRIEQEQETFDNLKPTEDIERVNWNDPDL